MSFVSLTKSSSTSQVPVQTAPGPSLHIRHLTDPLPLPSVVTTPGVRSTPIVLRGGWCLMVQVGPFFLPLPPDPVFLDRQNAPESNKRLSFLDLHIHLFSLIFVTSQEDVILRSRPGLPSAFRNPRPLSQDVVFSRWMTPGLPSKCKSAETPFCDLRVGERTREWTG